MIRATVKIKRQGKGTASLKSIRKGPDAVKVGFFGDKTTSIAVWQEFGTETIPERPFMRNAIRGNKGKYRGVAVPAAAAIIREVAAGGDPGKAKRKALAKIGILAQGDIQEEITALSSPPNAPSTIRQKGSSNPLIDTGAMRAAVSFKIDG